MSTYITVMDSIGGWKALMVCWNPTSGGFWEPYQTGIGAYRTREEAVAEGRCWAREEELEFRE